MRRSFCFWSLGEFFFSLSLIVLFSLDSYAFTRTRTSYGDPVKWNGTNPTINFKFLAKDVGSLSSSTVLGMLQTSAAQWNSLSNVNVNISTATGSDSDGQNSIYFTAAPYFGSGVIGVTSLSYRLTNGEIVEADILFNEGFTFSNNQEVTSNFYLNPLGNGVYFGDVATHELGHALGLGHSEVLNSTMLYTAFTGQATVAPDDKAASYSIYSSSVRGTISGKIVGGNSLTGVFGAHVSAISMKNGWVEAGVLSEADGSFTLTNLSLDDTYFLFVSPPNKLDAVPNFYSSAQTNFCSGSSYVGSFFRTCNDSDIGSAQGITVSSVTPTVSVGNISIRCDYEISSDYLDVKSQSPRTEITMNSVGGTQSGLFYTSEFTSPEVDTYYLDMRSVDTSGGNKYLELKVLSQHLYSRLHMQLQVKQYVTKTVLGSVTNRPNGVGIPAVHSSIDYIDDYNAILRIPLSTTTSENEFEIVVTPITETSAPNNFRFDFSGHREFQKSSNTYFLIHNIATLSGGTYTPTSYTSNSLLEDNSFCPSAAGTYAVSSVTSSRDTATQASNTSGTANKSSDSGGIGCGTVSIGGQGPPGGGGPGGPMGSLILGLALIPGLGLLLDRRHRKS